MILNTAFVGFVRFALGVALSLVGPVLASAAETITYTYDVHGRLVKVVHGGAVNNGVTATYVYDAADNRTSVTVTGSSNPAPS
jgi:uncharacterized protein RhaS with RHS repeats